MSGCNMEFTDRGEGGIAVARAQRRISLGNVEFINRGEKEVGAMDVDQTACHACPDPIDPALKNKREARGTHIDRGGKGASCHTRGGGRRRRRQLVERLVVRV
jgi:hypothetical protein